MLVALLPATVYTDSSLALLPSRLRIRHTSSLASNAFSALSAYAKAAPLLALPLSAVIVKAVVAASPPVVVSNFCISAVNFTVLSLVASFFCTKNAPNGCMVSVPVGVIH